MRVSTAQSDYHGPKDYAAGENKIQTTLTNIFIQTITLLIKLNSQRLSLNSHLKEKKKRNVHKLQ